MNVLISAAISTDGNPALIFELLPFGINDLVPTYVIEGIWTWFTTIKLANQAEEQLEEIKKK